MSIFLSSDSHHGHHNILEYSQRPFASIKEMDSEIIKRHNSVVKRDDIVYNLGDFSFYPFETSKRILEALNGKHILILGNHDRSVKKMTEMGFSEVYNSLTLNYNNKIIFMRHIPPSSLDNPNRQYKLQFKAPPPKYYDLFLCGHVHDKFLKRGKVINVGVDKWNFTPISLDILIEM